MLSGHTYTNTQKKEVRFAMILSENVLLITVSLTTTIAQ